MQENGLRGIDQFHQFAGDPEGIDRDFGGCQERFGQCRPLGFQLVDLIVTGVNPLQPIPTQSGFRGVEQLLNNDFGVAQDRYVRQMIPVEFLGIDVDLYMANLCIRKHSGGMALETASNGQNGIRGFSQFRRR